MVIPMDEPRFLSGKLLLAMPGIGDARFERAVIAVCSHDEQGALGIGIGHIVPQISLNALLKQFDIVFIAEKMMDTSRNFWPDVFQVLQFFKR